MSRKVDSFSGEMSEPEFLGYAQFTLEKTSDSVYWITPEARFFFVNDTACASWGYSREELLSMHVWDVTPDSKKETWKRQWEKLKKYGSITMESFHKTKEGNVIPVEVSINYHSLGDAEFGCVFARNISYRKKSEKELLKSNRGYRALTECAKILTRAEDEEQLLNEICKIIINIGEYKLAWIGFAEINDEKSVRPVAQAGFEDGYLDTIKVSWGASALAMGPTGSAIRTGKPFVIRDILTSLEFVPWKTEAEKRGYASVLGLPLSNEYGVFGALTIYAEEPDAFDKAEIALLNRLAEDLSYGINAIRTKADRWRAEEALKESEAKYRTLIENIQDGVFLIQNQRFIFVNEAFARMAGYDIDEIHDMNFQELLAEEDKELVASRYKERLDGLPVPNEYEFRMKNKEGETFYVNMHCDLTVYEGSPATIGTIKNITERKLAEERNREFHNRMITVLESIDAYVYVCDMETHLILYANRPLTEIFGNIVGKKCWSVLYANREKACENCKNNELVDEEGKPTAGIVWESQNQVTGRWYENRTRGIRWVDGRLVRLEISTDTTERKAAEEELRKAKEVAEEATMLKDKFVSLVSHDLLSPLSSMLGMLQLILDDNKNEEEKTTLSSILKTGKQMNQLIEGLLSISRLKTGKILPEYTFFDGHVLTKSTISSFAFQSEKKGVALINRIPEKTRFFGDPQLTGEVIHNLVSNAIKFSKKGQEVIVSKITGPEQGIMVADSGAGIPDKLKEKIFDYETKTSTPGTSGETGSGLGLPLCRDIMKAQNGELSFESTPGKGSLFMAKLPAVRPSILLIDDDDIFRYQQSEFLKNFDADILEAENGKDALEKIAQNRPHLVITDLIMPEMNGFELLTSLKSNPNTESIPVIVVSGERGNETRMKAIRSGADDFIIKPLNRDLFKKTVSRYIH